MRRLKLTLAYDGTDFFGWQVQPELPTIQGILEAIFEQIEKRPVHVAGSGRTDAGVHALAQVAAVSLDNPIPEDNLRRAVNRLLPGTIRLLDVVEVARDFHPRFDALKKTYEYRIHRGEICPPFERRFVYHHPYRLEEARIFAAAGLFEGQHDFSCFAASDDLDAEGKSKVRRIYSSRAWREGDRLVYRVTGSGFLKHMVRNIAGTLIEAGKGNLGPEDLMAFLSPRTESSRAVKKAGPTIPGCGLLLVNVEYGNTGQAATRTLAPWKEDA